MADKNRSKKIEQDFLNSYDELSGSIFRHIYLRVSNKETAQDITSETFMKTWDYLRKGNKIDNYKGFLYKVASNLIVDHYQEKAKKPVSIDTAESIPDDDVPTMTESLDKKMSVEKIREHLYSLPSDYKDIIIYRFIDELSIDEIEDITGKTSTHIYVIIHRALKILKEKLN